MPVRRLGFARVKQEDTGIREVVPRVRGPPSLPGKSYPVSTEMAARRLPETKQARTVIHAAPPRQNCSRIVDPTLPPYMTVSLAIQCSFRGQGG